MFEWLFAFIHNIIAQLGYIGIALLMALESMPFPIPSESVMPFAGYLIHTGQFSWHGVLIASSLGSISGSVLSYYLGYYQLQSVLYKYAKYIFLKTSVLNWTIEYFKTKGFFAIFVARFIPIVRHFISIPAGISQMNIWKFIICTGLGASIWNMILVYLGYTFGQNLHVIADYKHYIEIFMFVVILIIAIIFLRQIYSKNSLRH